MSHFRAVWFLSSMGAAAEPNPPDSCGADVKQQHFQAMTSVLMLGDSPGEPLPHFPPRSSPLGQSYQRLDVNPSSTSP